MKTASLLAKPQAEWRVGDLARLTGLTVRTLHHYEEVGLLEPASRTESGHRLYDETSVQQLYRVLALRSLGVSLIEVRRFIDDDAVCASILQRHLEHVEREVEQLTLLRDRLRRICRRPNSRLETNELLTTIELMSRLQRHVDARRLQAASRPTRSAEKQWRALGDELRACKKAGVAPSAPSALKIARRARALIHEFAGGDPAILEALDHLRTADPPADLAGWTPDLMSYLNDALRALGAKEKA
jgi:DNA-binding transcriptional MerR regulator